MSMTQPVLDWQTRHAAESFRQVHALYRLMHIVAADRTQSGGKSAGNISSVA